MQPDLAYEEGRLDMLKQRWFGMKHLAARLTSDGRWLSTPLAADDSLAAEAASERIALPWPLTIGTLLASVLAETDSVESAIHCLERRLHPKAVFHPDAAMSREWRGAAVGMTSSS